ncbi:MAG: TPM domain-containing protein [Leptospiraceae bacterium]|nr:TPM domain-containing protein [Leptospiraceae bacterium]
MKLFIIFLFFILNFTSIFSLDVPYLSGRVVDEVGLLDSVEKENLEKKLKDHEFKTSNQVAVLIIPTLDGEILEQYSIKVAETWKLGQKGKDNGVLLLIVKNDRKLRIEVGYGLEGKLTDLLCSRIINNEIVPEFKKGKFTRGIENGIDAILSSIEGTYDPEERAKEKESAKNLYFSFLESVGEANLPIFFRLFFGVIFFIVITPFTLLTAVTPYVGWFLYFFLIPFYATFPVVIFGKWGGLFLPVYVFLMFIIKIFFGFTSKGKKIAKKLEKKVGSSGSGSYSSGSYSSGSGSSGGYSSYSSGSSGGFSGGGGSFGGGGSSGSW